ncbi:phosphoribosyl-AMP cyclohydrolase [Tritonibacter multivorans]|uniref:Phosphoribosyl-AMP cyclohydrolase n=1 Tax=Tritonibacter multivorans TaxID=928856 RepID=A0A0P1GJK0_9RHOB|nr:phosphoribosyl-AMP cyclohydrolase [Tritonibacter multivorans]MDA7421576.1 phosphoribosyl-AMP cyclohydrolase [Tritonibacter multivorans]CUH82142.1 phosphoribosyl-AMP cyclohydrolase [Tritonibacter multivorans]SFC95115.1 phosphoribosyl-AMP cyclohydrolase [Tritonibacter multivorans]
MKEQKVFAMENATKFDVSSLKYNEAGLVPCIAQDHKSGEILMMAWMNAESIEKTLETGEVTYWSRSRQAFWVKGKTSGHVQHLVDFRVDCDRDALLALVTQKGPACHTNRRSCFYTAVRAGDEVELMKPMV